MGCVLKFTSTNNQYSAEIENEEEIKQLSSIFDEAVKMEYNLDFKCDVNQNIYNFLKRLFEYFYYNINEIKNKKKSKKIKGIGCSCLYAF